MLMWRNIGFLKDKEAEDWLKLIELLLKEITNINAKDKFGTTALFDAVENHNTTLGDPLLLRHGANVRVTNNEGKTSLDEARKWKNLWKYSSFDLIIEMLEDAEKEQENKMQE